jgi:hypothetical protein
MLHQRMTLFDGCNCQIFSWLLATMASFDEKKQRAIALVDFAAEKLAVEASEA